MHTANFITHLELRTFYGSSGYKFQREIPTGFEPKRSWAACPSFPYPCLQSGCKGISIPPPPLGEACSDNRPLTLQHCTPCFILSVDLAFLWHRGSRVSFHFCAFEPESPLSTVADRRHGVGGGHANNCPQAPGAGGRHTASHGEMAPKAVSGTGSPGCTGRGSWVAKSKGTRAARPGLRPMSPAV